MQWLTRPFSILHPDSTLITRLMLHTGDLIWVKTCEALSNTGQLATFREESAPAKQVSLRYSAWYWPAQHKQNKKNTDFTRSHVTFYENIEGREVSNKCICKRGAVKCLLIHPLSQWLHWFLLMK